MSKDFTQHITSELHKKPTTNHVLPVSLPSLHYSPLHTHPCHFIVTIQHHITANDIVRITLQLETQPEAAGCVRALPREWGKSAEKHVYVYGI